MTMYQYVGDGAGVPGLPHQVSDEEAAALGLTEMLNDAVKDGVYVETGAKPKSKSIPRPSVAGKGNQESEVSNG